jgi:hypothetical protein
MAKQLLNEAERFLLTKWNDAYLLEEAMEEVRKKYKGLFEEILDAVGESHPELDARRYFVTQFWTDGCLGFGRSSWPAGDSNWPSGLWMNGLRLEELASEETDPPNATIWLSTKAKIALDSDKARRVLDQQAKRLLTREELKGVFSAEEKGILLWLPAPSKRQLLDALADGDGEAFVNLFVSQFDMMAKFIPVLDKVFREFLIKE